MNINDIRGALGKPTHSNHSEAVLKALESHPCSDCGGPRPRALRASAKCLSCLRKEYVEDGLDGAEFDRRFAQVFGGADA